MMRRRVVFILLSFFLAPDKLILAQINPKWSGLGIEPNIFTASMIKHTPNFTGPITRNGFGVELNIFKQTWGQKEWHQRRKYPQIGIGIIYLDYNNPGIYGQVIGLYPTIQLTLLKYKNLEWVFRPGMGVGYVSNHYKRFPTLNYENVAIGGKWNNVSHFSSDIRWRFNKHWDFQIGANFTHVSNAAFQLPNLGINTWGAHMGTRYFPITSQPEKLKRNLTALPNRWLLQSRASMAFREKGAVDGPLYPVYIASLFVSKRYQSKNKIYAGVDYHHHTGTYAFLKSIEDERDNEFNASGQAAIFAGNEFLLGRVGLVFQAGVYFKKTYEQGDNLYQKLGGNFYFIQKEKGVVKELFLSAMLKTHLTVAELFEMGIGIGF